MLESVLKVAIKDQPSRQLHTLSLFLPFSLMPDLSFFLSPQKHGPEPLTTANDSSSYMCWYHGMAGSQILGPQAGGFLAVGEKEQAWSPWPPWISDDELAKFRSLSGTLMVWWSSLTFHKHASPLGQWWFTENMQEKNNYGTRKFKQRFLHCRSSPWDEIATKLMIIL